MLGGRQECRCIFPVCMSSGASTVRGEDPFPSRQCSVAGVTNRMIIGMLCLLLDSLFCPLVSVSTLPPKPGCLKYYSFILSLFFFTFSTSIYY